jgi:uncharacterized protein (TIGR02611 family)
MEWRASIKVIAGFGVLLAGIVMLAVPGPGWLTIAAGLAILAAEFAWARRALDSIKSVVLRVRRGLPKDSIWQRKSESKSSER